MAAYIETSMFLFDVPPSLIEKFCKIIDCGDCSLGWRDLAARILPSWLDLRCTERFEAAGKSPTRELLWSWAQKNKTVGDLLAVLKDMGHERALQLFRKGGNAQGRAITYSDVKEGTRNFHQNLKVGEGPFSEVYKGVKGNLTFAVKLFKQEKKASWKKLWDTFRTEVEVLQHHQHPNILEFWGCFSEADRYCLVTPYLPNGSLSHRLHDQVGVALSWQERLGIIKGTAKAVHHLHTAQPYSVICGNITSENILLDEWLKPKLSDFGMARLRPHSVNQSCTITLDARPHCTMGYLPEEYIRDGKLSVRLDVYSLGVRDMLYGAVEEQGGMDTCLCHLDPSAGRWPTAMALGLFRLALDSTASRPRGRPDMAMVLQVLSELLPLPSLPGDQPHTLEDPHPVTPAVSLPEEHDESQWVPEQFGGVPQVLQPKPCECSQSEVTFLSEGQGCSQPEIVFLDEGPGCSQSEVPGLGVQEQGGRAEVMQGWSSNLYGSWPVQCSCTAEQDSQECEDCRANGFTPSLEDIPKGDSAGCSQKQGVVGNLAKERFRDKIELYNTGVINTEELLSMKLD
ncbi:hypothetical protein JZ751_005521 [Albula glossodonta]|uniref:Protein kinase domain-containing protein n=1 Tax=Albula glossodonta TaxID=121402 RepID=A0A8T2N4M7_9TELE|nr:hypothetical protein JZ751_005521 [Albula glossodonta]